MSARHTRIGKFEIIHPIGEGAASAVYLARDTIIGREVALKTIQAAALIPAETRERFFREAVAASRLNHPNLVTVHEAGEDQGLAYLAMEHVQGKDLNQLFQERNLLPREWLDLLAQVCDALAYAHGRGVQHRDLRPSNVMVTTASGRPTAKVLDLGFTRLQGKDPAAQVAILAPEQAHSGKPDPRTDIFALGVLAYEALTGVHPFRAEDEAGSRTRLLKEDPAPLDLERLSAISPAIQGVLDRALAKDPNRRWPTAAALGEALRAARNPGWSPQADAEQLARDAKMRFIPNLPAPETEGEQRSSLALWAGMLVLVAGLGGGGWYWKHHRRRPAPTPVPALPIPQPPPAPLPTPPVPDQPANATQAPAQGGAPSQAPAQAGALSQAPAQAPAAQPAPAPVAAAPKVEAPAPQGPKSRYHTLGEAEAGLARDPASALTFLEGALAADPANERALALRIVALYDLGRYGPCARAMVEAKASGHTILALSLKAPLLHKMLQAEKEDPKLPHKPKPPAPAAAPKAEA